jgi:aryl-alcohol dehydrogenase-like predicted oxidoreductase
MTISGFATREGTTRYIERFPEQLEASSYRRYRKLRISSIGIGTYLGSASKEDDALYAQSISLAIQNGINSIDTASNYRGGRSEVVIGEVINSLISSGKIQRDELIVATKGGFSPLTENDLNHSLEPRSIAHELEQSLKRLQLDTIDLYYLHNPETQLLATDRDSFIEMIGEAFQLLEKQVSAGKIASYGVATWNGFRSEENHQEYLSLSDLVKIAQQVGGENHHFSAIQLPLNLSLTEAVSLKNQRVKNNKSNVLNCAAEHRISVVASASLSQGKLAKYQPPQKIKEQFKNLILNSHVAVQFSRSCPGVISALVGTRQPAHAQELISLLKTAPVPPENFIRLFEGNSDISVSMV